MMTVLLPYLLKKTSLISFIYFLFKEGFEPPTNGLARRQEPHDNLLQILRCVTDYSSVPLLSSLMTYQIV